MWAYSVKNKNMMILWYLWGKHLCIHSLFQKEKRKYISFIFFLTKIGGNTTFNANYSSLNFIFTEKKSKLTIITISSKSHYLHFRNWWLFFNTLFQGYILNQCLKTCNSHWRYTWYYFLAFKMWFRGIVMNSYYPGLSYMMTINDQTVFWMWMDNIDLFLSIMHRVSSFYHPFF